MIEGRYQTGMAFQESRACLGRGAQSQGQAVQNARCGFAEEAVCFSWIEARYPHRLEPGRQLVGFLDTTLQPIWRVGRQTKPQVNRGL